MRKNPIIALLLTVVMLFTVVAPVMALGAEVEWDDATKQAIIKMPKEKPGN